MHWTEEEARIQLTEELAARGVSGEEREWWEVGCTEGGTPARREPTRGRYGGGMWQEVGQESVRVDRGG